MWQRYEERSTTCWDSKTRFTSRSLLLVVMLVFGAKRLPEMGRSLGSGLRGFKESISGEVAPAPAPARSWGQEANRRPSNAEGRAQAIALSLSPQATALRPSRR